MFRWDLTLAIDLYLNALHFAARCYIIQIPDGESRPLIYNSFTSLPAEKHYNTFRYELDAIVKFTKKYSHLLHANLQSVVYTDHKPFIGFFNAKYHKNIFARSANKLCLLNIHIQYILGKRNIVADSWSRVIFNNANCSLNQLIRKLFKQVFLYQDDNEQFQKLGKEAYQDILMQFMAKDQAIQIQQYEKKAVSAFSVKQTSFY